MVLLNALIKSHIYYCIITFYSCISVSFQITVFQCDWFSLWFSIFEKYSSKKEPTGLIRLYDRFMASTKRKNWLTHVSLSGLHTRACLGIPWRVCENKFLASQLPISQVSDSAGLCQGLITCPSAKFLNEPNATDSELSEPLTYKGPPLCGLDIWALHAVRVLPGDLEWH